MDIEKKTKFTFIISILVLCISIACLVTTAVFMNKINDKYQINDDRTVRLYVDFGIVDIACVETKIPIGSLLHKPPTPTYKDRVFNDGIGGFWHIGEYELPLTVDKVNPGYDIDADYLFVGWYHDSEFTTEWDFTTDRIYKDITIYAKWEKI